MNMKKLNELKPTDELYIYVYLFEEFKKIGIILKEQQLETLNLGLFSKGTIDIEFSDEQLKNTIYNTEDDFKKDFCSILKNEENAIKFFQKIHNMEDDKEIRNKINILADTFAQERLEKIYKDVPEYFYKRQEEKINVEQVINNIWGHALDLYELLINTTIEITTNFNVSKLENFDDNFNLYDALGRLLGRGCLISNEILVLLKNGFADGANARCRTLYETMVISTFLADKKLGGEDVSKSYLDYSIVNEKKEANLFNQFVAVLDEQKIDKSELLELNEDVEYLKKEYGDNLEKSDYNWAYTIKNTEKHNISFTDLVKNVDFPQKRLFYKSASNQIHTSSSSLYNHIALPNEQTGQILLGASSYGIASPCFIASGFLNIISLNLLFQEMQTIEQQIQMSLLFKIREDLLDTFDQIEKAMEK